MDFTRISVRKFLSVRDEHSSFHAYTIRLGID
jgi:hypothetical protein